MEILFICCFEFRSTIVCKQLWNCVMLSALNGCFISKVFFFLLINRQVIKLKFNDRASNWKTREIISGSNMTSNTINEYLDLKTKTSKIKKVCQRKIISL